LTQVFTTDYYYKTANSGIQFKYTMGKKYCGRCQKFYTTDASRCPKVGCGKVLRTKPHGSGRKVFHDRVGTYTNLTGEINVIAPDRIDHEPGAICLNNL